MRQLLVEKYRPKTLDDVVFSYPKVKSIFQSFISSGEIPNLLISGSPGVGKTTLVRILLSELKVNKSDTLIINASSSSGIDTIREKIHDFVRSMPMGKFRVVVLEESDGLSLPAQKALRTLAEDYSASVRFIFTCNYPNKIIPALHSRCQGVHIADLNHDMVLERILTILDQENIGIDSLEDVLSHINPYTPDMRKIINSIDQFTMLGTLHRLPEGGSGGSSALDEWERIMSGKPSYEALAPLVVHVDGNNYNEFYRALYDNVDNLDKDLQNRAILIIAEHLYKAGVVADQEINIKACIMRIFLGLD